MYSNLPRYISVIYEHLLNKTGLTKAALAQCLGVSKQTVSRWGDDPPQYVYWGLQNLLRAQKGERLIDALKECLK